MHAAGIEILNDEAFDGETGRRRPREGLRNTKSWDIQGADEFNAIKADACESPRIPHDDTDILVTSLCARHISQCNSAQLFAIFPD